MKIFLDTADTKQIEQALKWGVIDGVTTNPTHVSKTGRTVSDLYPEIVKMVDGPVSLETIGLDADTIVKEGRELAKVGDNVVVKIPLMKEGLMAAKRLTSEEIKTNITTTFSPVQALLAAKVGATYISPFVGRLDYIGHNGMQLVEQIRQIYDNYGYETEIIVAAIRHPMHVLESALIGADVCTMSMDVLAMLYDHPLTDIGIEMFLKDYEKVPK